MKQFSRLAAFALCCVLALSILTLPSHAAQQYIATGSFWTALARGLSPLGRKLLFTWNDSVCAASKDARHSGYLTDERPGGFGGGGRGDEKTFYAKCQYCGELFRLTEEDIKNQYNEYVDSLPGTSTNGSGYFIPLVVESVDTSRYVSPNYMIVSGEGTNKISYVVSGNDGCPPPNSLTKFYLAPYIAPVSGDYSLCFDPGSNASFRICSPMNNKGNPILSGKYYLLPSMTLYASSSGNYSGYVSRAAGSAICSEGDYFYVKSGGTRSESFALYLYCKPAVLPSFVSDNDSRPTFGDGALGIIGNNGQITQINGDQIFDESTNLVYNPITGAKTEVSNWSYDYSDRKYYLTLGDGTTQEIQYGDDYITIREGDTVYNIYYVYQTDAESCAHDYVASVTTEPTCTVGGLDTYTCSKCGHSYTQKTPAAGHNWTVKQSVQTEYDEAGEIVHQGYTIYKCSVCGTEYKDSDGTGPPSVRPSDDSDDDGLLLGTLKKLIGSVFRLISSVFTSIIDGILTLITAAVDKLTQVVDLFGAFGQALSVLWSWLPADVVAVLTAGVTVVVLAAVLHVFLK